MITMEAMMRVAELITLDFEPACQGWLKTRRPHLADHTYEEYERNIAILTRWFGKYKLPEIDGDMIREFQSERGQEIHKKTGLVVGPNSINKESGLLIQIRKRIGMPILDYQRLKEPETECGRALSEEEKERIFRMGKENSHWEAVYLFAMISINTSAGPKEGLSLKLKDIDLPNRQIEIRGTKNIHRVRMVPLNDEALPAVVQAVERAKRLGASDPEHFLFPYLDPEERKYDPTRRMTSPHKAWYRMCEAAGVERLRLYDLRHHLITVMCENPNISEQTIEAIVGHVSARMKKRYSHIRMDRKRDALDKVVNRKVAHLKKPPRPVDYEIEAEVERRLAERINKMREK